MITVLYGGKAVSGMEEKSTEEKALRESENTEELCITSDTAEEEVAAKAVSEDSVGDKAVRAGALEAQAVGEENGSTAGSTVPDTASFVKSMDTRSTLAMLARVFFAVTSAVACAALCVCVISYTSEKELGALSLTRRIVSSVTGMEAAVVRSDGEKAPPRGSKAQEIPISETDAESESVESVAESTGAASEKEYSVPYYALSLTNETPYEPDMDEILSSPRAVPTLAELRAEYGNDAPFVLILHTHGSEAYAENADDGYRSTAFDKNVYAVGEEMAEVLRASGINVIHSDTLHDVGDFSTAYYSAALEIKRYLAEYPSISYIFDVHRDSMVLEDGSEYAPTSLIEGVKTAQVMLVVGTDYGGSGHTAWRDNLSLAARLWCLTEEDSPSMMRDINLRSASFNEQYTSGSLLIEVGSAGSSLSEAKESGIRLARQLAREIIG